MIKQVTLPGGDRVLSFRIRPGSRDEAIIGELEEGQFARCVFKPDDRWLDAGACIGTFSAAYAHRVQWIVAYEPEPGNYASLCHHLRENGALNVSPFRAALAGNEDYERALWVNPKRNLGIHSFFQWQKHLEPIQVWCENVGAVIRAHRINCLKLDVEGAEHELIHAIVDWWRIRQAVIEYHHHILEAQGQDGAFAEDVAYLRARFGQVEVDGPFGPRAGWSMIYCRKGSW